ncbi:glycosyltransferase family 2 protein [Photorhabdus sp. RM71S]|uniref:glycosyltransferase family 2 protein n=1 Tax=Photorhabdus sp. RM71S TaxID=3342824 RepID=UPI0036D92FD8
MSPKISIIIPAYNTEKYIQDCLESCINQTLKEIEIIIIDDCSIDNTINIAEQYKKKDDRIVILKNTCNKGPFYSRKNGTLHASGNYILYLDSDDFIDINTCKLTYELAIKNHADIINFGMQTIPYKKKHTFITGSTEIKSNEAIAYDIFIGNKSNRRIKMYPVCGHLFEKSLLKDAFKIMQFKKDKLKSCEDILQIFIISLLANKSIGTKDIFYFYRNNPTSTTRRNDDENINNRCNNHNMIIYYLNNLESTLLGDHIYFHKLKNKIINWLKYNNNFSKRYLRKSNNIIPAYLLYTTLSLRYCFRLKNVIRIIIYIFSLSTIKK